MNCAARIRLTLAAACALAAAAVHAQPAPRYAEVQRTSFYVTVRDGTKLAMDLYRPAVNGQPVTTPLPVIWQGSVARRLPPDQRQDSAIRRMPELARDGFVVAVVDRRGAGSSFGARRGYNDRTEARDAFDVTEWLAVQPWSSGQVGVYGCSNTGDAAMHAPTLMPPHLKAVFAGCFSFSKYDGFLRGGVFAQWGTGPERSTEEDLKNPPVDGDEAGVLLRQAVDDHRRNGPLGAMWRSMPFRDSWSDFTASRFWLEGSAGTYREAIARSGVALYIFGGFADDFRREGLVAFANLAGNPRRLVIGPWEHCRNGSFDLLGEARRFFDHFLRGVDNGLMREPLVRYHVQGAPEAEAWRGSDRWPPAASRGQTWQLQIGAAGGRDQTLGSTPAPAVGAGRVELPVQPPLPCPAGWNPQAPTCLQAANGVRFSGPLLERDTELVGHPVLRVWIASNRSDQNVFAYLEDVAPDGQAVPITDGRLKASLRKTVQPPLDFLGLPWQRSLEEDSAPLVPGELVELHFDLLPLAYRFKAGHRIRLSVTGSDPRERTPAPPGAVLTLAHDAAHPSTLTLPVLGSPSP